MLIIYYSTTFFINIGTLHTKFKLKPSAILGVIYVFIHIGAIFCVVLVSFLWLAKIALIACILTSLISIFRKHILLCDKNAITEFWRSNDGGWYLKNNSGEVVFVSIDYPIFVSSYLVIVNYVLPGTKIKDSIFIFKGMLLAEEFRGLIMLLRVNRV